MPITQIMTFSATPPTTGENPTTFNFNAISCWSEFKLTTIPNLNTAFTQMNDLETNVNNKEASTVYSADIATAAANFQGEWVSQGYTLGQSVSYGGTTYMCKLTHASGFAPTNATYWQPTGYAAIVNGATAKTIPDDADIIGIGDSVASFALKKLTWANIKTAFNLLYVGLTGNQTIAGIKTFISNPLSSAVQNTDANALTKYSYVDAGLSSKAPTVSPAFTGTPTAPTAPAMTNNSQLATTAYVDGKMVLATSVTASGTSIDFTGIPSWVKRITVMFDGVSTNGISNILIQIGDSGGVESTGYVSTSHYFSATSSQAQSTVNGILIASISATSSIIGAMELINLNGNIWVANGNIQKSTIDSNIVQGSKTLSAPLTQIRITTVNGTDIFDAGSINIMYEG